MRRRRRKKYLGTIEEWGWLTFWTFCGACFKFPPDEWFWSVGLFMGKCIWLVCTSWSFPPFSRTKVSLLLFRLIRWLFCFSSLFFSFFFDVFFLGYHKRYRIFEIKWLPWNDKVTSPPQTLEFSNVLIAWERLIEGLGFGLQNWVVFRPKWNEGLHPFKNHLSE